MGQQGLQAVAGHQRSKLAHERLTAGALWPPCATVRKRLVVHFVGGLDEGTVWQLVCWLPLVWVSSGFCLTASEPVAQSNGSNCSIAEGLDQLWGAQPVLTHPQLCHTSPLLVLNTPQPLLTDSLTHSHTLIPPTHCDVQHASPWVPFPSSTFPSGTQTWSGGPEATRLRACDDVRTCGGNV